MAEKRNFTIAGNWKMNTTLNEAVDLVNKIRSGAADFGRVETIVCPPFISLSKVKELLEGTSIQLGAQDVFYEEKGAFTGEISPGMLSSLCRYVIIGHSERRTYFHETDDVVNRKVKAAIRHGLKPIMCVGENLDEKDAGATESIINRQISLGLSGIESADLLIAYEPIWAIGTGRAATSAYANQVMNYIRELLCKILHTGKALRIPLLYGGSVNAENITDLLSQNDIDGALVGGASLKPDQFLSIIRQANELGSR
ncbi:triose-phosphate isomerase [Dehalogenimonas etheniformans]|uniref:Triosephosphate isomerase n=1 Tax=Dehalogenimonas etheniformans TaxID=1536648 RepID=A0A2P5P9H8_9CHLR|nr:triose-phosphate isomerase [Dehalogenimonas etheniformans]PPD58951.1 triose-phosphate isomerase [Dehalogenimonas etheniformans]QNT77133.1 triose-phosphate isomerase [Dehalogenimonas etheniformans]